MQNSHKLIKQHGIGAIQDNTVKDTDFVKLVLQLNIAIRKLGQNR